MGSRRTERQTFSNAAVNRADADGELSMLRSPRLVANVAFDHQRLANVCKDIAWTVPK
jgi:hypothetical protein